MATRTSRGAAAAALVTAMGVGLAALPATASAATASDAARAKAPSKLRLVSKVYNPVDSMYSGLTDYDATFLLKRKGHPYAGKRICLYVKIKNHGYLRGECHRTDAAGHALLHLGSNGKAVYYVKFAGDRRTKGSTKVVVIHGHTVPKA